jgi:hypothetical protein
MRQGEVDKFGFDLKMELEGNWNPWLHHHRSSKLSISSTT